MALSSKKGASPALYIGNKLNHLRKHPAALLRGILEKAHKDNALQDPPEMEEDEI